MVIDDRGPVVHQALLIHRLVELRHGNGLTQEKVARSLEWSHAKLMRYEGGILVERSTSVELRIVPLGTGVNWALVREQNRFTLFDFDDGLPPALRVEHQGRVVASKKDEDVHTYGDAFDRLMTEHALDAHQSRGVIMRRIGELGEENP